MLFVCPSLGYGGAETQLIALAKGLGARGHEVVIYSMSGQSERPHQLEEHGVKVIHDEKRSRLDFSLIGRMRAFVSAWQPEVVHGFLFDGNLYARLAAVANGGAVCLSAERSSDYSLRRAQTIGHHLTKHITRAVVANSYAGAEFARRLFAFPPERVHVVWNGIDLCAVRQRASLATGLRASLGMDHGDKLLCFVGSIKPEKDYVLALKIVRELLLIEAGKWHCLFIGAGYAKSMPYTVQEFDQSQAYAAVVEGLFSDLPSLARVHRFGAVDNVIELMAQSDVLLSTSIREGFPNVVLEAMASGLPVVSTEYSDIRRILPLPWQVVAERNVASLVSALERASGAEAKAVKLAQEVWVDQHASIEQAVLSLEAVYRACLLEAGK
nr:glycosyltransferase [Roseateles albus]